MTAKSAKEVLPQISLVILLAFSLFVVGLNVYVYLNRPAVVVALDPTDKKIEKLHAVIKEYPTHRDAYIKLAKLYENKGDINSARSLVKAAHKLDPLNEEVYEYGSVLGIRSF